MVQILHQSRSNSSIETPVCQSISEFYEMYTSDGRPRFSLKQTKPIDFEFSAPKTQTDAQLIAGIYEEIYQGSYPYPEMLDIEWLQKKFLDPNYIWGMIRVSQPVLGSGDFIGCFTIVLDYETMTGYWRGLMIRPKYQKKVSVKELSYSMIWTAVDQTQGKIAKWYCEARTAHNITQYLAYLIGGHTHGLLMNKDYFYHQKETDALMVTYTRDALYDLRNIATKIIPEAIAMYNHFRDIYGLNEVEADKTEYIVDSKKVQAVLQSISFFTENAGHGYQTILIHDTLVEDANPNEPQYLTGLYTPSVKNLEKIVLHVHDPATLQAFMTYLQTFIQIQEIEYFEIFVPAYDIMTQRILKDRGMQIMGYVPSWIRASNKKFDDAIIFGWSKFWPKRAAIQLLDEGQTLLNLISPP